MSKDAATIADLQRRLAASDNLCEELLAKNTEMDIKLIAQAAELNAKESLSPPKVITPVAPSTPPPKAAKWNRRVTHPERVPPLGGQKKALLGLTPPMENKSNTKTPDSMDNSFDTNVSFPFQTSPRELQTLPVHDPIESFSSTSSVIYPPGDHPSSYSVMCTSGSKITHIPTKQNATLSSPTLAVRAYSLRGADSFRREASPPPPISVTRWAVIHTPRSASVSVKTWRSPSEAMRRSTSARRLAEVLKNPGQDLPSQQDTSAKRVAIAKTGQYPDKVSSLVKPLAELLKGPFKEDLPLQSTPEAVSKTQKSPKSIPETAAVTRQAKWNRRVTHPDRVPPLGGPKKALLGLTPPMENKSNTKTPDSMDNSFDTNVSFPFQTSPRELQTLPVHDPIESFSSTSSVIYPPGDHPSSYSVMCTSGSKITHIPTKQNATLSSPTLAVRAYSLRGADSFRREASPPPPISVTRWAVIHTPRSASVSVKTWRSPSEAMRRSTSARRLAEVLKNPGQDLPSQQDTSAKRVAIAKIPQSLSEVSQQDTSVKRLAGPLKSPTEEDFSLKSTPEAAAETRQLSKEGSQRSKSAKSTPEVVSKTCQSPEEYRFRSRLEKRLAIDKTRQFRNEVRQLSPSAKRVAPKSPRQVSQQDTLGKRVAPNSPRQVSQQDTLGKRFAELQSKKELEALKALLVEELHGKLRLQEVKSAEERDRAPRSALEQSPTVVTDVWKLQSLETVIARQGKIITTLRAQIAASPSVKTKVEAYVRSYTMTDIPPAVAPTVVTRNPQSPREVSRRGTRGTSAKPLVLRQQRNRTEKAWK